MAETNRTLELVPHNPPLVLRHECEATGLAGGLRWFAREAGPGSVLVSTPRSFSVLTVDATGEIQGRPDTAGLDLDTAYEARAFTTGDRNAAAELRWRATPGGGDAVLVRLGQPDPGASDPEPSDPGPLVHATITGGGYLLWGTVESHGGDWVRLHASQVGTLDVPVGHLEGIEQGAYLRLTTVEAIGQDGHGNATILDELLTGWEVV
ncbi:type III-D CRISPR-associated protein Csx19 [Rhabdothermincola sediminis]|uniref:type III-D CRISPR-associated protein Csx19 n=1 Tax=Rhabdothermincola sediminis TaxID=2751370 RepID=UPI001AA0ABCF|nr:CRISPR-associated protein Csx19 [Rhabdothermincola sediminis]